MIIVSHWSLTAQIKKIFSPFEDLTINLLQRPLHYETMNTDFCRMVVKQVSETEKVIIQYTAELRLFYKKNM